MFGSPPDAVELHFPVAPASTAKGEAQGCYSSAAPEGLLVHCSTLSSDHPHLYAAKELDFCRTD